MAAVGSMVVVTMICKRGSSGSIHQRNQIYSFLLSQNCCIEMVGEKGHEVMCRGRQLCLAE